MVATLDHAHCYEVTKLLCQNLFADTADQPPDFGEPRRAILNMIQDQRLPFTPYDFQRNVQPARRI